MSNPVVTVHVPAATAVPRGAEFLGGVAAVVCTLVLSAAHAVAAVAAARPERRHA